MACAIIMTVAPHTLFFWRTKRLFSPMSGPFHKEKRLRGPDKGKQKKSVRATRWSEATYISWSRTRLPVDCVAVSLAQSWTTGNVIASRTYKSVLTCPQFVGHEVTAVSQHRVAATKM